MENKFRFGLIKRFFQALKTLQNENKSSTTCISRTNVIVGQIICSLKEWGYISLQALQLPFTQDQGSKGKF